jgi:hypothetical protein
MITSFVIATLHLLPIAATSSLVVVTMLLLSIVAASSNWYKLVFNIVVVGV